MNYELAKKLKDAGFPQKNDRALFEDDFVCYPTLSELIEVCGDYFVILFHNPLRHEWLAADNTESSKAKFMGEGATPEIAVANFWIALRDKKLV